MNDSWFFDKNFNGISDDFFDDAIKLLDFPPEDVELNDGEDWKTQFQGLDPPPSNVLASLSSFFTGESSNRPLKVEKSSTATWHNGAEASSSRSTSFHHESVEGKHANLFRMSSPISVLDNSSSCSAEKMISNHVKFVIPVKRPRSKRPRARRHAVSFISACSASKGFCPLGTYELDSDLESYQAERISNPTKKRQKKKKNLTLLSRTVEINKNCSQQAVETRKCTHCEVTETPQWREGPMGPKTLCNACGVRYRSGRLLPEYRPAASPTFIPSLHSNSHRKVLEMRKKAVPATTTTPMDAPLPTLQGY
uniref:GATA-type domain-containing protein n=2 Tax=Rhizophora mucronata TaxID=61149 RepID=A0A2P2LDR0_RHIMU